MVQSKTGQPEGQPAGVDDLKALFWRLLLRRSVGFLKSSLVRDNAGHIWLCVDLSSDSLIEFNVVALKGFSSVPIQQHLGLGIVGHRRYKSRFRRRKIAFILQDRQIR